MGPTRQTRIFRNGILNGMIFVGWEARALSVIRIRLIGAAFSKEVGQLESVRSPARAASPQAGRFAGALAVPGSLHPAAERPKPIQRSAPARPAASRCP